MRSMRHIGARAMIPSGQPIEIADILFLRLAARILMAATG